MTRTCTICCCISLAGHMHLIHVQLAIWTLANHTLLPAGYSLPATPFSARQRYCRRYGPRHGPATGTCPGIATASIESGPALHLHRAPPRWHPLQQLPFVTHVRPAPAMMRLHRDLSLIYFSSHHRLRLCTCTSSSINNDEHQISRPSQRRISCLLFALFSSSLAEANSRREEGLPTLSCSATKLV